MEHKKVSNTGFGFLYSVYIILARHIIKQSWNSRAEFWDVESQMSLSYEAKFVKEMHWFYLV